MQDVYRARDLLLETDVALKTPQAGQASRRFKQSAILAARVNHYNVAKTLDYVEESGSVYLVEEFVQGETLEDKVARYGLLDPYLGALVLHHLSKAIAASHHAGVIHRDLKPSNVMTESGVNIRTLKITDFGIATLADELLEEAAQDGNLTLSTSGTIKGALPYMAPEMMFRQPGDHPGPPTDIWSIGAMMFRLLTGEYPFGVFLQAAVNVQNRVRKDWPNFMTSKPQFRPLSQELQAIVEACLSYEPNQRPTADQLVEMCGQLCYSTAERLDGTVTRLIQNGYSGFLNTSAGSLFFSMDSVYGPKRPDQAGNSNVSVARYPGLPNARAHPIIVIAAP
jgi:serine/threonine-protein kinase